jgi:hypothetical protein
MGVYGFFFSLCPLLVSFAEMLPEGDGLLRG